MGSGMPDALPLTPTVIESRVSFVRLHDEAHPPTRGRTERAQSDTSRSLATPVGGRRSQAAATATA